SSLYGRDVQDVTGAKIGTVGQVWANTAGEPTFVSVKTGIFGRKESMAPLQTARMSDDRLTIPYEKGKVEDAPRVEAETDQPLDEAETAQLYAHYQLQPETVATTRGATTQGRPQATAAQRRMSAGQEELTRSEERLRVGTESEPVGTAKLRKYVVTEDVHTTVPVEHDEVRLEREPITAENARGVRPEMSEAEREMTLRAEHPVVGKDRVPVERVRMYKDEVIEDQPIDDRVSHEEIETNMPPSSRRRGGSS
ncbi:MAG TPA: PRC and DUF2382 domain-containing protein, partial [Micromonospora sp.]